MRAEQKLHHWNSPKRQRTLSLTDAVWEEISDLAEDHKINRSEVIEIIARLASDRKDDLIVKRLELLT
jgi:predicted DNA-binding ribbon-helix-helix protein|tara:strand:- start:926 stop:1129 length:204 start_codon:yes stop_codon:yes gene_type:complete